jgi:lambda repressor-like predicted transcriptional regulator
MDSTETERDWAERAAIIGQFDQAGEAVRESARMLALYYRTLIAEGMPKRVAAEMTYGYQEMIMAAALAAMEQHAERA